MKYKKSRFNYVVDNGRELRLYNSLAGSQSLLLAKGRSYGEVKQILCEDIVVENAECFSSFTTLRSYGYLISENVDEDVLLEQRLNDVVNPSKLYLVIMPTEDCNFRCSYCYETHLKGKMSLETQNAIIKYVRNNIKYYTGVNIGWFGGEPLEALDVIRHLSEKLIEICKVARKPYRAGITTNAYHLTPEVFRELYRLHVYEYQISIDGLREEHDKLRKLADGSGSFNRIINNIKAIKSIRDITASKIVIRTNFTKTIVSKLDEYVTFYNNLLEGDSRFSLQINMASDWGGDDVKSIKEDLLSLEDYINLINRMGIMKSNINFSYHLQELNPAEFKCYAGKKNCYCIGSDAKIYKCTESFDMPENNIGVLLPDGRMEIDPYLDALWSSAAGLSTKIKCANCSYCGCCLYSPCPRNTLKNKDRMPVCPRTKGIVRAILNLLDQSQYRIIE